MPCDEEGGMSKVEDGGDAAAANAMADKSSKEAEFGKNLPLCAFSPPWCCRRYPAEMPSLSVRCVGGNVQRCKGRV
eukprot:6091434-Pleurochrysis_carterae.AAC.1